MRKLLGLILTLCLMTTGCHSERLDRKAFMMMLAVDQKDGKTTVTGIFPKLTGGSDVKSEYTTMTASGDDLDAAMELLYAASPFELNFDQLRLLALGEEATKQGIRPIVDYLSTIPRVRMNMAVLSVKGEAADFIGEIKPDFGNLVSKFLNIKLEKLAVQQLAPRSTLGQTRRDLMSDRRDTLLIYGSVNEKLKKEAEKKEKESGEEGGSSQEAFAQAGELLEKGDDPAEMLGSVALSQGRYAKALTGEETRLLLALEGRARLSGDTVLLPKDAGAQAAALVEKLLKLSSDPLGLCHLAAIEGMSDLRPRLGELEVGYWE